MRAIDHHDPSPTMSDPQTIGVLFVCLGNICRSPTAEGVFRRLADEQGLSPYLRVDSAGTHAYHVGEPPDPRSQKAARARGVDLSMLRARRIDHGDFYHFDHILAMDSSNLANLRDMSPHDASAQLKLFLDYAPHRGVRDVPDPYYGGGNGFERVLDLVEDAAMGLLDELKIALGRQPKESST
jgi:protein-tyrosine phosphatase